MRKKAAETDTPAVVEEDTEYQKACRRRWAILIRRIYEVDPMACPQCGGKMKEEVLEKILKHCGLWEGSPERTPPSLDGFTEDPGEVAEVESVDIDTFFAEL